MNRFLNNKFNDKENVKVVDDKVETMFVIPYIGLPSVVFGRKLREIFKRYYGIDIRVVFTSFKVKNYFSLKCRTPLSLSANVVYQFKCLCDASQVYIGKTTRHLAVRVKEHGTSPSAVFEHFGVCERCKENFSVNSLGNFSILDHGRNDFETTVKEAIHIKRKRPSLNKQLYTQGTSFILNIF